MKIKIKELKKKSDKELNDLLKESREKLRSMRFDMTTKKVKDIHDLRKTRLRIAQVLTILRERTHDSTEKNPK